jgi:LPXTG-motif cell wall-anchored protein
MIDCYNSTYVYYSIDFCDANVGDESPSLSVSLSPSSSASSTASSPPQASTGPSTGTIVGAVVGGVAGLGLVIGAVLYYIRRRRRTEEMHEAQLGPPDLLMRYEVHGDNRQELPSGTGFYKNHAAVEIEQPPTELPGSDMRQVDGGRFR